MKPLLTKESRTSSTLRLTGGGACVCAETTVDGADQPVGYLHGGTGALEQPFIDGFVDELRILGWVEGENVTVEWRFADSHYELLPELATQLVQLQVDVLVTPGVDSQIAYHATSTIPIVMVLGPEPTLPIASGMVQTLARPGANVTGTASGATAYNAKGVELLKTLLPYLLPLAVLVGKSNGSEPELRPPVEHAAQTLGIQTLDLDSPRTQDADRVFEDARAWGADALYVFPTAAATWARISELAAQTHLPVMYPASPRVVSTFGGLMSYGPDFPAAWPQGAEYVDKILPGAKPSDLPVQEPRQYDFVVNLKAAQDLGIAFPPDVAAQVTQWIQ
jgi:putative ABC transport system substrate-binding protein